MFLSSLLASSSLHYLRPIKSQKPYGPRDDDLKRTVKPYVALGYPSWLKMAKDRGFKRIHVESDSLTAIKFNNGCTDSHQCQPLMREIKKLVSEGERIQVAHVFREVKQVADRLANHGLGLNY